MRLENHVRIGGWKELEVDGTCLAEAVGLQAKEDSVLEGCHVDFVAVQLQQEG